MVTRYEDVREALTNPETFSSRPGAGAGGANDATKAHAAVFEERGWVKQEPSSELTHPSIHTIERSSDEFSQIETLRR